MFYLLAWAAIGLVIGILTYLYSPARIRIRLFPQLMLGMFGAIAAGLFSWTVWRFPADRIPFEHGATTPEVTSYFLAAFGSLVVLTFSFGILARAR